jgi:hypothetical protein
MAWENSGLTVNLKPGVHRNPFERPMRAVLAAKEVGSRNTPSPVGRPIQAFLTHRA